jgi:hypothetical protein
MGSYGRKGFPNFQKIKQRGFPVHVIGNISKNFFVFSIHISIQHDQLIRKIRFRALKKHFGWKKFKTLNIPFFFVELIIFQDMRSFYFSHFFQIVKQFWFRIQSSLFKTSKSIFLNHLPVLYWNVYKNAETFLLTFAIPCTANPRYFNIWAWEKIFSTIRTYRYPQ